MFAREAIHLSGSKFFFNGFVFDRFFSNGFVSDKFFSDGFVSQLGWMKMKVLYLYI